MPSDNTKTGAELVSRPPQRKLQRPYSPGREGFFDVMQELMFEKLSNNDIQVSATKHTAIVYSVVKEEGFLGIFPTMIRVRAKFTNAKKL